MPSGGPPSARRRRLLPSLQARLTLVFAAGALVLSVTLSLIAFSVSRGYLISQQEEAATRQAYNNARMVRDGLLPGNADVTALLTSAGTAAGSESVVEYRGRWYASALAEGRATLPTQLRETVLAGQPARQLFDLPRGPQLAVGLPLPEVGAAYFQIVDLASLTATLRGIAVGLTVAAAVTTVAGAVLGLWTSRRLVGPLREVARASSQIAQGELDTRLAVGPDRELATLARSFNDMADALQRRIERDARFAADVSHELRSPLTTLGVSLGVLQARADQLPARSQQAVALLGRELTRFQRLVVDLLEMARTDATSADLDFEEVRVAELFLRVCAETLPPRIPVGVEAAAMESIVRADKRRLERVLVNLFDNAERHGGGVVAAGLRPDPAGVRIEVDDAGPGVPATDRERIFERFARGPAGAGRDRTAGAGLGLALARENVTLHGGRIWAEDRPGGGARFVVALPVVAAGLPEAADG